MVNLLVPRIGNETKQITAFARRLGLLNRWWLLLTSGLNGDWQNCWKFTHLKTHYHITSNGSIASPTSNKQSHHVTDLLLRDNVRRLSCDFCGLQWESHRLKKCTLKKACYDAGALIRCCAKGASRGLHINPLFQKTRPQKASLASKN